MMMWRGSSLSLLLHGSVFFGLVFGLPALPDIFDRKKLVSAESELPVTVEVVTAEQVEKLLDVITPDRVERPARDQSVGWLAPLSIAKLPPADDPQAEDVSPADRASASDRRRVTKDDDSGGSRQTRIPEGQLNRQKIEQSRRQRAGGDLRRNQAQPDQTEIENIQPVPPRPKPKPTPDNAPAGTDAPPEQARSQQDPGDQV